VSEALPIPSWTQAMQEMTVLEQNETEALVTLPPGKKAVGCKWAHYQVKPKWVSDSLKGEIDCQKLLTGI